MHPLRLFPSMEELLLFTTMTDCPKVQAHNTTPLRQRVFVCMRSLGNGRHTSPTWCLTWCRLSAFSHTQDDLGIVKRLFCFCLQLLDKGRKFGDLAIEISLALRFKVLELLLESAQFPRYPALLPRQLLRFLSRILKPLQLFLYAVLCCHF